MIVTQSTQKVNATRFWGGSPADVAFEFGKEDATEGEDRRGSQYFDAGTRDFHAYNVGYNAGLALVAILEGDSAADDGRGNHALGYTLISEQNDERRQRIILQVRYAATAQARQQALNAAMMYDPGLWQMLTATYR